MACEGRSSIVGGAFGGRGKGLEEQWGCRLCVADEGAVLIGKPLAGGDGRSRNVWLAKEGAGVMMVPLLGEGRSCSREDGRSRYGWLAKEGAVV